MTQPPVRAAATIIVLRDFPGDTQVLMGQRGAKAVFMPNKFVFPGGAVDPGDGDVELAGALQNPCATRLTERCDGTPPQTLAAAAIRELWEETGLALGQNAVWSAPNDDWRGFANRGLQPDAQNLHFFFRAITPPGRPRRFDARFFLLNADHLIGDLDDFSAASDELSHLNWVPLSQARALNLPFITEVVLGEIAGLTHIGPPASIPFFENTDTASQFHRLGQSAD